MPVSLVRRTVSVAAVATPQTTGVYQVQKGQRVHSVSLMFLTSAAGGSTATISVGDSGLTTRYLNAVTAVGASGVLVDGVVYQYLYTAMDVISVIYTPGVGPGATAPSVMVCVEVETVWPKSQ